MRWCSAISILLVLAGCGAQEGIKRVTPKSPEASVSEPSEAPSHERANTLPRGSVPGSKVVPKASESVPTSVTPSRRIESVEQTSKAIKMDHQVAANDLGVSFYPGSSDYPAGDLKATGPRGTSLTSTRITEDAALKVMDFYEKQLGTPLSSNRKTAEPVEVWRVDKALITVSTEKVGDQTKIIVTTSPSP